MATKSVILRNYLVMPEHLLYSLFAFCYAFGCNLLESSIAIYVMYCAVNPDSNFLLILFQEKHSVTNVGQVGTASFQ